MDHKKLQVQIKDNCQKHIKFKGKVRQRLWILSRRMDMIDMELCELDCVIFFVGFLHESYFTRKSYIVTFYMTKNYWRKLL